MTPCTIHSRPGASGNSTTLPRLLFASRAPAARSPDATATEAGDQLAPASPLRAQRMTASGDASADAEYQQASSVPDDISAIAGPWLVFPAGVGSGVACGGPGDAAPEGATAASRSTSAPP